MGQGLILVLGTLSLNGVDWFKEQISSTHQHHPFEIMEPLPLPQAQLASQKYSKPTWTLELLVSYFLALSKQISYHSSRPQ